MQAEKYFEKTIEKKIKIPYLLYLPKDFDISKKLPMIVFLHGAGERGESFDDLKGQGLAKIFDNVTDKQCIVLSPHCIGEEVWHNRVADIMELIDSVANEYNADKKRISITGLSMGAYGTWEMIMSYPKYFSKAACICGGSMPWRAYTIKDMPIWVFHGDKDDIVNISNSYDMVEELKRLGGNIKFTVYENTWHDSWTKAYNESGVVDWLLE